MAPRQRSVPSVRKLLLAASTAQLPSASAELRRAARSRGAEAPDWGLRTAVAQDVARRPEIADFGRVALAIRSSADAAQSANATQQDWGLRAATGQELARHKANASMNATYGPGQFMHAEPAVGKVFSLYYSHYSDEQASSVEAYESDYTPQAKSDGYIFDRNTMLPAPSCSLRLRSQTNYPTDIRDANMRLAAIAICSRLSAHGAELPSCGASGDQVCEMKMLVRMPSSDELQEPYIGAAVALAAYSKICALGRDPYNSYQCAIQRAGNAICAGLQMQGGSVTLRGLNSPGLLDLKLDDA